MTDGRVERFWREYLDTLLPGSPARSEDCLAESFGDSPGMADELGASILSGTKTATCSARWEYEAENEPLPEVGQTMVVLDGGGEPLCVIETTDVGVIPFGEVDEEFAFEEGEGDLTLAYWREAHRRFFDRTLPDIGREFSPGMPLVCERFRVVYRAGSQP